MTRKTTPKKPSQLDRIEKLLRTTRAIMDGKIIVGDDRLDNMLGKLDLLLKGSDFMKEIGEKEEPWVPNEGELAVVNCDDYPTLCPRGTIGILRKPEGYARDLFAMYFNGDKWNFRIREVREPLPAEVQKYEEQVKAQEQEAKKAKLVWGTKVMYGNSEGIFLDHDDNDNTCWVALKPTGNCDWLSISDLTIIDP